MKKILYSTLIALAMSIGYIAITRTQTEIQFKPDSEFQQAYQKQLASIKQKENGLIQIYDFIISNKTERISKH